MLRKHYFKFDKGQVDYEHSFVEDDKGNVKTVNDTHNLRKSEPGVPVYDPVFFDTAGANIKKSEEYTGPETLNDEDLHQSSHSAKSKISKSLDSIEQGLKMTLTKSDVDSLNDKELFSFVMNNPRYSMDYDVQRRFEKASLHYKLT